MASVQALSESDRRVVALWAAAYAAKAAALADTDQEAARRTEVQWQIGHMNAQVRAALATLPPLGTDSAGPLGQGLLTSGALGQTIREIQADLARPSATA